MNKIKTRFEIVVRAIIKNHGRILFVKRAKNPQKGKWCLPGGKVIPTTHCHVIYFTGLVKGNLKIQKDEIEKVKYLTKKEILKSKNIAFDHQEVLQKLL